MSGKSGILGELEVARSVPLRLLQRIVADVHIDIDGPFAAELNAELAQHAQADKSNRGYTTLDLTRASQLLGDSTALMRLAYAGGRFVMLPWRCDADRLITVLPGNNLSELATDGQDTWGWCISEDGTCTVEIHSFLPEPIEAEISFRLVQPDGGGRQVTLDGLLLAKDGHIRFERQLNPGRTDMCFALANDVVPVRHGGRPFHFAIYNVVVSVPGKVSQGFGLEAQSYGATPQESKADSSKFDEISIRRALHAAGFQYATWAALTRMSAAVEMAPWSRGIPFEPAPFNLDDCARYGGSLMKKGLIYWFLAIHSRTDRERWAV